MRIDGDIPPGLESIAPDIRELNVKNLQDEDQLMRWVRLPQYVNEY